MNDGEKDSAVIWQALGSILDPEFGVSIVDLGLIYQVEKTARAVKVVMTLTTPTCPSGGWIYEGVKTVLSELPGVTRVQVDLVFDPLWHSGLLTEAGRRQLGA